MSRIPLRALNRPLTGKHGRFNRAPQPVVATPEPEVTVTEPEVVIAEPEVVATTATEPEVAVTTTEPEVAVTEPDTTVTTPEWEPTWTKAQLLVVAQSKGLAVTSANSKAEIIAALTAAG